MIRKESKVVCVQRCFRRGELHIVLVRRLPGVHQYLGNFASSDEVLYEGPEKDAPEELLRAALE